jgi:short chain dehydrogenase
MRPTPATGATTDAVSMRESQKIAIVTGASQGIGAGLAAALRRAGYAVVGTSRSIRSCDEPDFVTVQGDIGEVDTAQRVVEQALDRFGRIDSLINNAGIFIGKPFTDYTLDDYAAVTAVNLAGFFHITRPADGTPYDTTRRYLDDTMVLETIHHGQRLGDAPRRGASEPAMRPALARATMRPASGRRPWLRILVSPERGDIPRACHRRSCSSSPFGRDDQCVRACLPGRQGCGPRPGPSSTALHASELPFDASSALTRPARSSRSNARPWGTEARCL